MQQLVPNDPVLLPRVLENVTKDPVSLPRVSLPFSKVLERLSINKDTSTKSDDTQQYTKTRSYTKSIHSNKHNHVSPLTNKENNNSSSVPRQRTNWQNRNLQQKSSRYPLRSSGQNWYRTCATDSLQAQHIFQPSVSHIFDATGKKQSLDSLLQGPNGDTRWNPALSNEWGCLAQGNDAGVESTNTIDFISKQSVPTDNSITYASFACDHCPLKDEMACAHCSWRRQVGICKRFRFSCS